MTSGHVADVLAHELDRAATTASARFVIRPGRVPSEGQPDVVHTVLRIDDGVAVPVADVYTVDHTAPFRDEQVPVRPVGRVLVLGLTVLAGIVVWCGALLRRSPKPKSLAQMLQLLLCLGVLLLMGIYLLLAVIAVVQLAVAVGSGGDGHAITPPQTVVVVTSVLAVLFPGARERLAATAEQYLRTMRYIWLSGPKSTLRGEVLAVLERIAERPDVDRIHVLGFSFGSLVALDTVFPSSRAPSPRVGRISTLVTVGSPFELASMLHPGYAEGRFAPDGGGLRWVNIYEPIDLLGSSFSDERGARRGLRLTDGHEILPEVNLAWNPGQRLTAVNALMLASLRVHAQYWGPDPQAETALGLAVPHLFPTPTLA
ncbi:MAG TPA: hypothetical protein VGO78_16395 [Acidimicrobiales bacterium]|nr:hypothetical protein [Acidimicrobiales bacterium]